MNSQLDDVQREMANCLQDSAVLMADMKKLQQRVDAWSPEARKASIETRKSGKIAAYGSALTSSQQKAIGGGVRLNQPNKPMSNRSSKEIEQEIQNVTMEAERLKDSRGAYPKNLVRKLDKLSLELRTNQNATK